MNRFQVAPGAEAEFEQVWTSRDSMLRDVPGFVQFHLLRGAKEESHSLYSSHTVWCDRDAFIAWTESEAFRAAHRDAGNHRHLYVGPPKFEGFEVVQMIGG